jgi:O-antigen/teichoic acid export membrane protein
MKLKLASLYLENALRLIYNICILLLIKKIYGDEVFSVVSYALTLGAISYGLGKFSLDNLSIKLIIEEKFEVVRCVAAFRNMFSALACLMVCAYALLISHEIFMNSPELLLLILLQLFRTFDSVEWYLRVDERLEFQSFSRIFSMLIPFCLLIIVDFLHLQVNVQNLVIILSTEWIVIAIIYSMANKRSDYIGRYKMGYSKLVKPTLIQALPLFLSFFAYMIYQRIDQLALIEFIPIAEYGYYSLAAKLNESSIVVIQSLSIILFPQLVRMGVGIDFFYQFRKYTIVLFLLALLIQVAIYVFSLLQIRYSFEFIPNKTLSIMRLLGLSMVIYFAMGLRSAYFVIIGKTKTMLIGSLLAIVAATPISIILISRFGINGAVIGNIFTSSVALIISNFVTHEGRVFLMALISPERAYARSIAGDKGMRNV